MYVVLGAHTPFLLRKNLVEVGMGQTYHLVGEWCVHGRIIGKGLGMGTEEDIVLS